MAKDPICGMTVAETFSLHTERGGKTFFFCSEHCRQKFITQPAAEASQADDMRGGDRDLGSVGGSRSAPQTSGTTSNATVMAKPLGVTEPRSRDFTPEPGGTAEHIHFDHDHETATVTPSTARKYFCPMCPGVESDKPGDCLKCGMALELTPAWVAPATGKMLYTCPMHPEVQQDHPGDCPKCGMALEPKTVAAGADETENAELRNMTKRFWIGAVLTLPVFVLAMAHLIPALAQQSWADSHVSRWLQFALTTPVVWWAGWSFFRRGWRSLVTRQLNMFTLISIGVGAAFVSSAVAMLAPDLFPHTMQHEGKVGIYFEAAAVIIVLVLLGQMLELRARSRTGSAIKALLNLAPPVARRVTPQGDEEIPLESWMAIPMLRNP
jgi:Cu+-exporting ATPase